MKKSNMTLLGLLVCLTTISAQADVLFMEEFDGANKAYVANSADSTGNVWVDFGNRVGVSDISGVEGYTTASGGTESVLAGTPPTSGDPQIRSDFDVGIADGASITNISLRIRLDKDDNQVFDDAIIGGNISLFYGESQYAALGGNAAGAGTVNPDSFPGAYSRTITDDGNGWHIINYACSTGTVSAIRSLRIDPGNTQVGKSFEIDYLKIEAIPEPATLGLVAAVGGGVLFIRRRLMM